MYAAQMVWKPRRASRRVYPGGLPTALEHLRSLPAKGKLALAAYSTSTEPAKVRFDQLRLAREKKKDK